MGLFGQTPQKTPKEQVCWIFMKDDLKYYQLSGAYRQACNVQFRFQALTFKLSISTLLVKYRSNCRISGHLKAIKLWPVFDRKWDAV